MTTLSTPRAGTPQREPFSKRVLRLEHAANVGPLLHIVMYVVVLAFALLTPLATNIFVAPLLVLGLTLLNYSLTIGVLHMHTHRPLFVSRRPNRIVDLMCCLPGALTAADMREVHILNHHRYNDGPGDVTSTQTRETGLRAVVYWIRYGVLVKVYTIGKVFTGDLSASRKKRRTTFIVDFGVVLVTVFTLSYVFPGRMALFYWLPFIVTQLTTGYFAWLTHAPARVFEDDASRSINTVGNWLNFWIFNQGYHSVHHRYPGIHWSEIPDKLTYMRQVEPDVIVGYWVTLNSAWRIARPQRFLNAAYGTRWQAKLEQRLAGDGVRSKYLPWFAWI